MYLRARYTIDTDVTSITIDDIIYYLEMMVDFGWDQNSFTARCNALKRFFEYFQLKGYPVLQPKLIPTPRPRYKLPRIVDAGDYEKMLAAIPKTDDPHHVRNLVIAQMVWDTGARIGEVLGLDTDELEDRKATIRTEKSRNRRPFRVILWTGETQKNLERWLGIREKFEKMFKFNEANALFVSVDNRHAGYRFGYKGFTDAVLKYCKEAGIPYINPHSARHKMAVDVLNKGGLADVQNVLGHSSLASSSVYTMMDPKQVETVYRSVRGDQLSTVISIDTI